MMGLCYEGVLESDGKGTWKIKAPKGTHLYPVHVDPKLVADTTGVGHGERVRYQLERQINGALMLKDRALQVIKLAPIEEDEDGYDEDYSMVAVHV